MIRFLSHPHAEPKSLGDLVEAEAARGADDEDMAWEARSLASNVARMLGIVVDSLPVETQRVIGAKLMLVEAESEGATPP